MGQLKLAALVGILALVALETSAGGSRRTEFFRFDIGPFDEVVVNCDSFDVRNSYGGTVRLVVRYDKAGVEVQSVQHNVFTDSIYYNSTRPELFVEGVAERTNLRIVDGLILISGPAYRVTVPGSGLVFVWTGHWVFNPATGAFEAQHGPSDLLEGDVAALCRALAP